MTDPQTERFVGQVPALLAELERRAKVLFGLDLAPTPDSLPALEQIAGFLWQMRESFDEEDRRIDVLLLGTYLGEIMRRTEGGIWQVDPTQGLPLVHLPDGRSVSPIAAAQARLSLGEPPLTES